MPELYIGTRFGTAENKIDISSATVTLATSNFTYDGTRKEQNVASVVLNGITLIAGTDYIVCNNSRTNAGTYALYVVGIGDYTGIATASWSIAKATGSISVSPSSIDILGVAGETNTATLTVVGDGAISVNSGDIGVATVERSGNTLIVTSVDSGTANITITLAASTNYTGDSATLAITVVIANPTLSDNTPEQIQAVARTGIASSLWSVGEKTGEISIGAFGGIAATTNVSAFIIGFDHNSSREGTGIHFQFGKIGTTDVAFYSLNMNRSDTISGGWNDSSMRKTYCAAFLAALPTAWQNVIASTTKYSDNTGGSNISSYVTSTSDKIFLLSEWEVFGKRSYANSSEQNYQLQYDYYKNGNSRIKYKHNDTATAIHWWLRSVYVGSSGNFCVVSGTGYLSSDGYAANNYGFAPGFKVA